MDIEHYLHRGYRASVIVSIIVSLVIVLLVSFLGRRASNLKGSLVLGEPNDITVIALMEPTLATGSIITNIRFLRKVDAASIDQRPNYAYLVTTSDNAKHLLKIGWSTTNMQWMIAMDETLHE